MHLGAKVDADEPESREVMGFVRSEGGLPVAKAAVYMQHQTNFRRYLRRVETDDQGYFQFAGVPGGEPYFVFALPPGDITAMRHYDYFGVPALLREVWRELTLHPHRVTGLVEAASAESVFQLVHVDEGKERVLWSFRAEPSGRFTITNVPHGRYRVQTLPAKRGRVARSLPLEVKDGGSEVFVQWPKASISPFEIF